ncbi:MAG: A/G-specific adenine glycosylase [Sphingobium sp.]|nr:A/G-specific adenine glycosylase [Sphingobium sp.]
MPVDSMIAPALLNWYDRHRRVLPWRALPGERADPYRVWLSEIMLQQTTVAAVKPYFEKFTSRWPDVHALARADEGELMAAWAGLGYYARARNLIACARALVQDHGGIFPGTEAALLTLPGVGAYTAAAIAAIAFDQPAAVVDANVERVVSRLFAIATPLPASRPEIRKATARITPAKRPGDFAQAMMDLGATICTVRDPACMMCPLADHCAAKGAGDPARYPFKAPKKARPQRYGHVWWIEADAQVWLIRRPAKGLLGGMRALPSSDWGDAPERVPPLGGAWQALNTPVIHVFTHFALQLTVHRLLLRVAAEKRCMEELDGEWWAIERLEEAGLPTVFAKAAAVALAKSDTD